MVLCPSCCTTKMFNKQEAVDFVQNCWGLQRVEERLSTDRTALLDDIATAVHSHVRFQNMTLMALPLSQRKRPNLDAIKEDCMSGAGGLCYSINVFTWGLLNGLGFSAHLCPATVFTTVTSPDNHVFTLVNDAEKKGDLHLVECACGYPTFRAVSLNFEEESPVFVDSFLEYKFIRHNGEYLRMHGEGERIKRDDPPVEGLDFFVGKWRRFYSFTLRPTDNVSNFDAEFDKVYTVPGTTPFHHSLRTLIFPNKRAAISIDKRQLLENEEGKLETIYLEEDEKILETIHRQCPNIKRETIRAAIQEWHKMKK